MVQKATLAAKGRKKSNTDNDIRIDLEKVEVEEAREAGTIHVGHQNWQRLGLDQLLAEVGFSHKACLLT